MHRSHQLQISRFYEGKTNSAPKRPPSLRSRDLPSPFARPESFMSRWLSKQGAREGTREAQKISHSQSTGTEFLARACVCALRQPHLRKYMKTVVITNFPHALSSSFPCPPLIPPPFLRIDEPVEKKAQTSTQQLELAPLQNLVLWKTNSAGFDVEKLDDRNE